MNILYAPWRSEYSSGVNEKTKKEDATAEDCVFCTQFNENNDEKYWIIKRFEHTVVMLNKYPYNAGHLLILPFKHCKDLTSLSAQERAELMEVTNLATDILQKKLNAHGFNLGLNLGKAAGAGIPSHLHMHVLPRWTGDTNFMPTLAQTRQISFDLQKIYETFKDAFANE